MSEINTGIVDKAIEFATRKHSGAARKGTKIPYIVHPMEAATIVAGLTDDQNLIAAAILHDTLEDTETEYEELVETFSDHIAQLVFEESEDKQEEKPAEETWEDRKQTTIDELKKASYESKILVLGDKLANIRAIQRDLNDEGESFWQRFNQKDPAKQGWYYSSIAEILAKEPKLKDTQACKEFTERVKAVFDIYLKK